ncbi:MAG: acyltransferase [Tannerellaceae bacterium]|nr:acyltransferase [Tannerellaceae bacterium]
MILNDKIISLVKEKNNFNLIRFFLAYSIMFNHCSTLTESEPFWIVNGDMRVKGFFIISGFLVMFSFIRTPDLTIYLRKRFCRIMPAYLITIFLCIILGSFLTSLTPIEYFSSTQLYQYLIGNSLTLNFLQPELPGVFTNNPIQVVNGSLWTMKVEIMLYFTVPLLFLFLLKHKKSWFLIGIYLFSMLYSYLFEYLYDNTGVNLYLFLKRQFPGQMMYFCSGIIILLYFDSFRKYKWYIFPVSIFILLFRTIPGIDLLEPIALASFIICIVYSFKWLHFIGKLGNFSYGIYLFHFPIIQTFIHFGIDKYHLPLTFILTAVLSTILGILSWYYIENPLLYTKKNTQNHCKY